MIPVFVKLTVDRPPEVAARRFAGITKAAHLEEGRHWHRELLPEHFKRSARSKYGYAARKLSYLGRKWNAAKKGKVKYGGMVDLVYTGRMEEMLKSIAQVRSYPTRARVTMVGPRYITMRRFAGDRSRAAREGWKYGKGKGKKIRDTGRGSGVQPDKIKEVTAVTDDEAKQLSQLLHKSVITSLEKIRSPKTVVLK